VGRKCSLECRQWIKGEKAFTMDFGQYQGENGEKDQHNTTYDSSTN
jgi:hypothetical protein